jgi:hypothetical protein
MMGSIDQSAHPLILRLHLSDFDRERLGLLSELLRARGAAHPEEARTSVAIARSLGRMLEEEQPDPNKC